MNDISSALQTLTDMTSQMNSWPVAVLIVVVLAVAGGALKAFGLFPNRYIPLTLMVLGVVFSVMLGELSDKVRHPKLLLGLQGFLLWAFSWAFHILVLKRFEKFVPFLGGRQDDDQGKN